MAPEPRGTSNNAITVLVSTPVAQVDSILLILQFTNEKAMLVQRFTEISREEQATEQTTEFKIKVRSLTGTVFSNQWWNVCHGPIL